MKEPEIKETILILKFPQTMRFYFPTHAKKQMEEGIFSHHQSMKPFSQWCSQQH